MYQFLKIKNNFLKNLEHCLKILEPFFKNDEPKEIEKGK
jgi:hypothetical protein